MRKFILVFSFILLAIWDFIALWEYTPYGILSRGGYDNTLSTGFSLLIEAFTVIAIVVNYRGYRDRLTRIVIIWFLFTTMSLFLYHGNLILELQKILWWPFIYFLFSGVFRNDFDDKSIGVLKKYFIPIVFFVNVFLFAVLRFYGLDDFLVGIEKGQANNQIFYITLLVPLLFLIDSRRLRYALLLLALTMSLVSFKRSAQIIIFMIIALSVLMGVKNQKAHLGSFILAIAIVCISFFIYKYISNLTDNYIIDRFRSIQDDGGSGRVDIWRSVYSHFSEQNLFHFLFGSGYNTVQIHSWAIDDGVAVSAHNDFFEILCDYGIVGLLIYSVFVIRFIKNCIFIKKYNYQLFSANIALLVVFFVMSSVSHLFLYPTYFAFLIVLIAYTNEAVRRIRVRNNSLSH